MAGFTVLDAEASACLGLRGHLGMRVSVTPLTPKLMHMLHNPVQNVELQLQPQAVYQLVLFCGKIVGSMLGERQDCDINSHLVLKHKLRI